MASDTVQPKLNIVGYCQGKGGCFQEVVYHAIRKDGTQESTCKEHVAIVSETFAVYDPKTREKIW